MKILFMEPCFRVIKDLVETKKLNAYTFIKIIYYFCGAVHECAAATKHYILSTLS